MQDWKTDLERRRIVLFDAGGTLITLDYARIRAAAGLSADQAPDHLLDRAEGRARVWGADAVSQGIESRALWNGYFGRLLREAGLAESGLERSLQALWEANRALGLWRRPVPGARQVLEKLRSQGRRLGVVSNAEGQVARDLDEAGFEGLFETVVDSGLVGVSKPDPQIFLIALDRMKAEPVDAVYIGDVPAYDVEGARAAGILPILLDPHGIHQNWEGIPRLSSLEEVPALLGC